jgi:SAM-dependent methyltransferase
MNCGLCQSSYFTKINGADERNYYLCGNCSLISVSKYNFISHSKEREIYLTHNNGIDQPGYVEFLNRAVKPALKYLTKTMTGLDYGCGYAPTLSEILARQGYKCENYDPFFVPNDLDLKYDFIFSTEVFEHFCRPEIEMRKITELLKPGGILIIMTERWQSLKQFNNWYYTRDPSHIVFYNKNTFKFISNKFGYTKLYDDHKRITIHRKNETA